MESDTLEKLASIIAGLTEEERETLSDLVDEIYEKRLNKAINALNELYKNSSEKKKREIEEKLSNL